MSGYAGMKRRGSEWNINVIRISLSLLLALFLMSSCGGGSSGGGGGGDSGGGDSSSDSSDSTDEQPATVTPDETVATPPPTTEPPPTAPTAPAPPPATTVPYVDSGSPFGFHPAGIYKSGYANNGYQDAQNIGVRWTRPWLYAFWFLIQPDLGVNTYDFSLYDRMYLDVPDGIGILANISHIADDYPDYSIPGSYMPADTDKYIAFVKATVERYDGDGVDDVPGLTNPIKHWQVGNEPGTTFASDFADLQKISYTAIKEACPDCAVLIGGALSSSPRGFDHYYRPFLEGLGGQYLDVMDMHWFGDAMGDYKEIKNLYTHIRAVLDGYGLQSSSIWVNETGAYSGQPSDEQPLAYQSERQQAADYLKRIVYYLSIGIRRVFPAFGLIEGFRGDNGYFDHTGLIYDGLGTDDAGLGVKKLAYYTYKKITETLEDSDWDNIETVSESDFVYVYMFTKKTTGAKVYVAWWDYFDDPSYVVGVPKQVAISWPSLIAPTVTEALPMYSTGAEVSDYGAAFTRYTAIVNSGSASFSLMDSPVFIE